MTVVLIFIVFFTLWTNRVSGLWLHTAYELQEAKANCPFHFPNHWHSCSTIHVNVAFYNYVLFRLQSYEYIWPTDLYTHKQIGRKINLVLLNWNMSIGVSSTVLDRCRVWTLWNFYFTWSILFCFAVHCTSPCKLVLKGAL